MPASGYSEYDVVLLPTFTRVEAWRKRRAREQAGGLFGPAVSTFNAWVADLWELHGDGRALVDSVQRAVVMRAAFAQVATPAEPEGGVSGANGAKGAAPGGEASQGAVPDDALTLVPGLSEMAARCEMHAAGVREYDEAVRAAGEGVTAEGLAVREQLFLRGIDRYRRLLRELGLVELGEACRELSARAGEVFPRPPRVLMDEAAPLDWRMQRFFEASGIAPDVRYADGPAGIGRLRAGVRPRFAFPAGRYAVPALVMQLVEELQEGEMAVVACADPLALYRQLEPALAAKGLAGAVQGQVGFCSTDFGRAYLLADRIANDERFDAAALADLAHSPFAGFGASRAREVDACLRGDRLARREDWLERLRGESGAFAKLLDLAQARDGGDKLAFFEAMARETPGRSPAWRSEQLAAIAALGAVRKAGDALSADWRDRKALLERVLVAVSAAGTVAGAQGAPTVTVTTQGVAAQLGEGSHTLLIAADLTSESYPLADKDDVATTLFTKLHLPPLEDALSRARRTFAALEKVPARAFVCLRPLNDAEGNPTYASAMLQEFVDAYRQDAAEDGGLCGLDDLPEALREGLLERGEEFLFANSQADAGKQPQSAVSVETVGMPGLQVPPSADALLLPRRLGADRPPLRLSPSPSQVELYLECPYKWFVSRRLGLEGLEEGFGPLEKGTFAHAVLERFYRRFMREVGAKVAVRELPQARSMLAEEADAVRAEMRDEKPGSGRLVAAGELEEHQIDQLVGQLADYLDYEAALLPGFHPAYLEYAFEADAAPEYAGARMVGAVDRIDVDDAGHAVVIDYKGSVNGEHDIAGKDAGHAGKVQARIYAQLVKRELGLDVVGALYVSYGKRHEVAGAVDGRTIEAAHLPGAHAKAVWCAPDDVPPEEVSTFAELSFPQMLDATERLVQDALARMARGDVEPRPATPDVCRFCPAEQCPRKGV